MKKNSYILIGILILIIITFSFIGYRNSKLPGKYDDFAKCLTQNGVKFYGTYWCPHCNNQKRTLKN